MTYKYKKFLPEHNENPEFTHKPFLPNIPKVMKLQTQAQAIIAEDMQRIALPDDPKEYKKALKRMTEYAKAYKKQIKPKT